ncbi:MAG: RNA polymerase sigma factor [Ilumatobacter sp.]
MESAARSSEAVGPPDRPRSRRQTIGTAVDLDQFVASVRPQLVGVLTIRTGDRHVAEDLAQEALARAIADWATVGSMASPIGWVHRVALNLAASHWRRLAARRRAERRTDRNEAAPPLLTAEAIALRAALEHLSERQRQVILLRYYVGFDVADTALALEIAPSTVTTLTARAVASLRRGLEDDDGR